VIGSPGRPVVKKVLDRTFGLFMELKVGLVMTLYIPSRARLYGGSNGAPGFGVGGLVASAIRDGTGSPGRPDVRKVLGGI
jgi:hypothetical protein